MSEATETKTDNLARSKPKPRENMLLSLVFNLVIPNFILIKMSDEVWLGPLWGLVVALIFPLSYGVFDFWRRSHFNLISALGFAGVLLTGGIGLAKLGGIWFAVKEAAIPAIIGLAIYLTQNSEKPLLQTLFLNDQVLNLERVKQALDETDTHLQFNAIMRHCTTLVSLSFFISAVINFILAVLIIDSAPGTAEFNREVGYMNTVSYVVIVVPCVSLMLFAMWRLLVGLRRLTGLTIEEIIRQS